MRTFTLLRHEDVSNVSGTGKVAQGVEFDDLTVSLRWFGVRASTNNYVCIDDVVSVHCHGDKSEVVWHDSKLHRVADRVAGGLAFNRIEASRDHPVQVEVNGRDLWLEWLRAFSSADHPEDAATREGLRPEEYYLWRYRWVDPTGAVLVTYLTAGDE